MNKIKSVRIMCPNCFNLSETINISFNTVSWISMDINLLIDSATCPICNAHSFHTSEEFIELDNDIAETISILNKKGYYTEFCCQGHGEYNGDDANIVFKVQPNLINKIINLPDGWIVEKRILDPRAVIVHEYSDDKQYLNDIQKWAEELPSLMEE